MKNFRLVSIVYSPGYCDMSGGYHRMKLKMNGEGKWVIVSEDRDNFQEPMVTTERGVSDDAVAELEDFIRKRRFISLCRRVKSKVFITDYSPWYFDVEVEHTVLGEKRCDDYKIAEDKVYFPGGL